MKIFECNRCGYKTDRFSNLSKHENTKKHKEKVGEPTIANLDVIIALSSDDDVVAEKKVKSHICDKCEKGFATRQSLFVHRKNCKIEAIGNSKLIEENSKLKIKMAEYEMKIRDNEIEQLKNQLKEQANQLKEQVKDKESLKDQLKEQAKDKESFKKLAENSIEVSNKSMSALNYAIKHYNNAPAIQVFNNFAIFLEGNEKYYLDEIMIHYYQKNKLCSYIGDKLIKEYKKADPITQSMWVGDVNRSSYILKESNKDDIGSTWNSDKEGVSMAKYMIKPALDHIKNELLDYNDKVCPVIQRINLEESKRKIYMKNLEYSASIIQSINNNELTGDIIKYMAPHFYLNRTGNNAKEIEILPIDKEEPIKIIGLD